MRSESTRTFVVAGLLIALLCISAWIVIPFGPIPFTAQLATLCLIVLVATPRSAIFAISGYLVIGMFGLPVFSGGQGGLGVFLGPTGGFLFGFFIGVVLSELYRARSAKGKVPEQARDIISLIIVVMISYACGCFQFAAITHTSLVQALLVSVAPFVIFDVIKIALALVLVRPVRRAVSYGATLVAQKDPSS